MEESYVILVEVTHVVDVVLEHYDSLNAETECKTAVYLGIDAAVAENLRMYHTAAEDLDPALALTKSASLAAASEAGNVDLSGRLCEGEMVRTEADSCILAEHGLSKGLKSTLKVTHCNALVYYKTLYLMEERRVCCVNRVGAVNASGRDDLDGGLSLLHNSRLNGRCL